MKSRFRCFLLLAIVFSLIFSSYISIPVEASEHVHNEKCFYIGAHYHEEHTEDCYGWIRCRNGCIEHIHVGNKYTNYGCFTEYDSEEWMTCDLCGGIGAVGDCPTIMWDVGPCSCNDGQVPYDYPCSSCNGSGSVACTGTITSENTGGQGTWGGTGGSCGYCDDKTDSSGNMIGSSDPDYITWSCDTCGAGSTYGSEVYCSGCGNKINTAMGEPPHHNSLTCGSCGGSGRHSGWTTCSSCGGNSLRDIACTDCYHHDGSGYERKCDNTCNGLHSEDKKNHIGIWGNCKTHKSVYNTTCGLTQGVFYIDEETATVCPVCEGTGKEWDLACGMTPGHWYCSADPNYVLPDPSHPPVIEVFPVCDEVVTDLVPYTNPQTVLHDNNLTDVDKRATATFLDGHSEEVECQLMGAELNKVGVAQTVYLTYGDYCTTAWYVGPKSVPISLTINIANDVHIEDCYIGDIHAIHNSNCYNSSATCGNCTKHTHVAACGSFSSTPCTSCGGSGKKPSLCSCVYSGTTSSCTSCGGSPFYGYYECYECKGLGYKSSSSYICGKTANKYYLGDKLCPVCGGDNKVSKLKCNKVNGYYYNTDGTRSMPICDKVVLSLTPKFAEQVVPYRSLPDASCNVVFLASKHVEGFKNPESVTASYTGFRDDEAVWEKIQTLTLRYGDYYLRAKNKASASTTIKVKVLGEFEITFNPRGANESVGTESIKIIYGSLGEDITIPKKTGYTFLGYFTETYGNGIQYYDANGKCIKEWNIAKDTTLYAKWSQDPVITPQVNPYVSPTPVPSDSVIGDVSRKDSNVLIYANDYDNSTNYDNDLQPYLVNEGIPSTEEVNLRARLGSYMYKYNLHLYSNIDVVDIVVRVPYIQQWELNDGTENLDFKEGVAEYTIKVPKNYSYWEILESSYYLPEILNVNNDSLESNIVKTIDKDVSNGAVKTPSYTVKHYGDKKNHVKWEDHNGDGIGSWVITYPDTVYMISNKLGVAPVIDVFCEPIAINHARADKTQPDVKNDLLIFNDITVLDDTVVKQNGVTINKSSLPTRDSQIDMTNYCQSYVSDIDLVDIIANGLYNSTSSIIYKPVTGNVGSSGDKTVIIDSINDVLIHTPIVCNGIIDSKLELTERLNFFTVDVTNNGTHITRQGYNTRDFEYSLKNTLNIKENLVQFPFGVYLDVDKNTRGSIYNTIDDVYYPANTLISLGLDEHVFYVPITMENGDYTVKFYSVAINDQDNDIIGKNANINLNEYVVMNEVVVTVTDSNIYDPSDDNEIDSVKDFIGNFNISITDTNNIDANKLLSNSVQALTLPQGYYFNFRLDTFGKYFDSNCSIKITPKYTWVSSDMSERIETDIYYNGTINNESVGYIKFGNDLDLQNIHSFKNTDKRLGIPKSLLENTRALDSSFKFDTNVDLFSYTNMRMSTPLRVFELLDNSMIATEYCGICYKLNSGCSHMSNKAVDTIEDLDKVYSKWYGTFELPNEIFVIPTNTMEGYCNKCNSIRYCTETNPICSHCSTKLSSLLPFDFETYRNYNSFDANTSEIFRHDGFVYITFDIEIIDNDGNSIKYDNFSATEIYKDATELGLNFSITDVIRYDLSHLMSDDLGVGGSD